MKLTLKRLLLLIIILFYAIEGAAQSVGFYRIISVPSNNSFLSLVNDYFSYTDIVRAAGGLTPLSNNSQDAYDKGRAEACRQIESDFDLSESLCDPGAVIYIDRSKNLFVQGTNLKYVTDGYTCTSPTYSNIHIEGLNATITQSGMYYYVGVNVKVKIYALFIPVTKELGMIYMENQNGNLSISSIQNTSNNNQMWILKKIDETSNFFHVNPQIFCGGKFYTSFRSGFSFKVKNPDRVKVYKVVSTNNGLASLQAYSSESEIPYGVPVIIESSSNNPEDNILIPVNAAPNATSTYADSNTVLYNKYGYRQHTYDPSKSSNNNIDTRTEDGIGFFKSPYTGTSTIYKLGVKKGVVGFWEKIEQNEIVSGNEGYSYDQCALFEAVFTPDIIPGNAEAFLGQTINVTLSCETSGATIKYSTDGGTTWSNYSAAIPVTATTTIQAKAVKNGVESEVATATYTFSSLDAPTITPTSMSEIVGTDITFNVSKVTNRADAVTQYSIDGGAWQTVTNNQITVSSATAKNGIVKVRNFIANLNVASDEVTATYTFTALSAPAITPASAEAEVGETITFTATNPNGGSSTMQYRIDGGAWTTTTGTITVTSNEAKTGTVEVKVINGNAESSVASATYTFAEAYQDIKLANLVNKPVDDTKYNITDLTCIYVIDNAGLLICKDDTCYASKDVTENGWIDYMQQVSGLNVPETYDQSNWIALRLPQGESLSSDMILKPLTGVKGHLVNATNLEFQLDAMPDFGSRVTFTPNTYIPASFKGTQESANGKTYFFVQPKPMEYAHIEWAVSRGVKFVTAPRDLEHGINTAGLSGEFEFNGMYLGDFGLEWDHVYMMDALIKRYTDNFDHVYVMGNVDGLVFDSRKGVEMYTADGKVYTATVTVSNAEGNNNGFFGFTKELGATYESIAAYRYGADANNKYVTAGKYAVNKNTNSFKILPGTYTLTLDMTKGELIIAAPSANAPRRADAQSTARYIVYPVHLTETSNSIITGVMNVAGAREVAAVEYVNLAGQRSSRPWQGVNIVVTRYTDGTVTTAKECK